ncbi:glycosyltransferase family A protein, partial [Acinetobacter baumannii]
EAAQNGGPVHARNRAFAEARGRYVAGLDQDDLCTPDRFGRQVAFLDANPDVVLVGANARYLDGARQSASAYAPLTTPTLVEW